jgi:hypothetical protein
VSQTSGPAAMSGRTFRIGLISLGTTLHGLVASLVAAEKAARRRGYSLGITTTEAGQSGGVASAIEAVL